MTSPPSKTIRPPRFLSPHHLASQPKLRLALVHDWLTGMRGGEKCLEALCEGTVALMAGHVDAGADAVLVHHGIFWRGAGEMRVERALRARLKLLLDAEMSLLAYHLPLDRHPAHGNAAVLARELETGTFRYAWTQGFGRRRWALAKLVLLAVVLADHLLRHKAQNG